ncbi:MAG: hypothetical protein KDH96_12450, partial [Candidatus Riesia sp.]|nr:hypothetical protein [Candidatus Riesia sp.]
RLPGESNFSYSERIKDSHKNKSGPNFSGIINGASRELNIKKVIEAIKITLDKTDNKDYKVLSVDIDVTNYSLRISAVPLVYTETLRVDPVYKTITFRYLPKETPNFIDTHSSKAILPKDVELITEEDESRIVYKAKLNTNSDLVTVSYPHYFEFLFSRYTTLGDLIMAINSTLVAGNKVLTASIDKRLSGNESTNGLYIKSITALPNQSSYLSWSPIYLKKMTDVGYKSSYLDGTNTLKQTDYYSYVKELKNNTKVFWGAVESDRDRWDSADSRDLSMASIPTLFDPPLARYTSVLSGQVVIVDPMEAWARNYIGYNGEVMENEGLTSLAFQPGVAHTNDLMPDIHLTNSYYNTNNNQDYNIGPVKNDNKVVIFSGQK